MKAKKQLKHKLLDKIFEFRSESFISRFDFFYGVVDLDRNSSTAYYYGGADNYEISFDKNLIQPFLAELKHPHTTDYNSDLSHALCESLKKC